jgi:hypothetical protein
MSQNSQNTHTNHTTDMTSSSGPHGQGSANRVANGPTAGLSRAGEKSVSTQAAYGRVRAASDEATGAHHTYGIVRSYLTAANLKGLDAAKSNIDASFDFFRQLLGVKTISEAVVLQAAYAQKLFDALRIQMTDLHGSAQKAAVDATKLSRTAFEKGIKQSPAKVRN